MNIKAMAIPLFIFGCTAGRPALDISIEKRVGGDTLEIVCVFRNTGSNPIFIENVFSDRVVTQIRDTMRVRYLGVSDQVHPNQFLAPYLEKVNPSQSLKKIII